MALPGRRLGAAVAGLLLALLLGSCGGPATAARADEALAGSLPVSQHARPLDVGSATCSPDGGIYVDRTTIRFYYARDVPLADLMPLLSGAQARSARELSGLGPLLEVVAVAHNLGAATCGVGLTQTVLETSSRYGGTAHLDPRGLRGAIRQSYYEPIRPIVVLSNNRLDLCSASVNPGASVWLLAVFPPVRQGVPLALVNPSPQYGFFLPVRRGAVPAAVPTQLYSEDVDHCIQILSTG